MPAEDLIPTEMSDAEEVAGFRLTEIEHPDDQRASRPRKIHAVVYRHGQSYRLVKIRHPARQGAYYYSLFGFGVYDFAPDDKPWWLPLEYRAGYDESDPNQAVEELGRWLKESPAPRFIPKVPPQES